MALPGILIPKTTTNNASYAEVQIMTALAIRSNEDSSDRDSLVNSWLACMEEERKTLERLSKKKVVSVDKHKPNRKMLSMLQESIRQFFDNMNQFDGFYKSWIECIYSIWQFLVVAFVKPKFREKAGAEKAATGEANRVTKEFDVDQLNDKFVINIVQFELLQILYRFYGMLNKVEIQTMKSAAQELVNRLVCIFTLCSLAFWKTVKTHILDIVNAWDNYCNNGRLAPIDYIGNILVAKEKNEDDMKAIDYRQLLELFLDFRKFVELPDDLENIAVITQLLLDPSVFAEESKK
jgi:hypothetical protein